MTPKLRIDAHQTARGGYSHFMRILCAKCDHNLASYQKDGPGLLRRLYHDRITSDTWPIHASGAVATCPNCNKPIAFAYMYSKENRPCWLPIQYTLKKRPHSYLQYIVCFLRGLPHIIKEGI